MPAAMSHMGMSLGVFVIMWSGIAAGFGLYLQVRCAEYIDVGTASFSALSGLTYAGASVVFDAAIAIKCFGVGVSYLIVIGDLMPGVFQAFLGSDFEGSYFMDRQFWITVFMLIIIPLAFLRRLDSLKYTSFIALVSIGYLIILVVAHFIKGDTLQDRGEVLYFRWTSGLSFLASFPVVVFAYTCHQNMFSIINEISNSTRARNTNVVVSSIGVACSLYILVAITGYLSYGNNIRSNIISMYPPSLSSTVGRAAIVVLVMFSYPLQVHPCRSSFNDVLKWVSARTGSVDDSAATTSLLGPSTSGSGNTYSDEVRPSPSVTTPRSPSFRSSSPSKAETMSDTRFAILTTGIVVLSYIVAMSVSSLEKVLAYVGSTGSTSISFILPGLFYYKISDPNSPHHGRWLEDHKPASVYLRYMALALAIYGVVVMVVCLGTNFFLV